MLEEYIDFVTSIFPSISPYTQESAKRCLRQFYEKQKEFPCFTYEPITGELCQGDIIRSIPFRRINDDGEEEIFNTDALVISNSCDIENDPQILLAPFMPIDRLEVDINTLKSNCIYNLLFFPDLHYSEKVADLSLISPFPKLRVMQKINNKEIDRLFSLNTIGFYLFISKISVHLLRPEDCGVQNYRKILFN